MSICLRNSSSAKIIILLSLYKSFDSSSGDKTISSIDEALADPPSASLKFLATVDCRKEHCGL